MLFTQSEGDPLHSEKSCRFLLWGLEILQQSPDGELQECLELNNCNAAPSLGRRNDP